MPLVLKLLHRLIVTVLVLFASLFSPLHSWAGPQVMLTWRDNSTNENGFIIERRQETKETFTPIGRAPQNIPSYVDTNVVLGARYCYRVQSFNSEGVSSYSNEACSVAANPEAPVSLSISVVGQGRITSDPAGISCAPTCKKDFARRTVVVLTVVPVTGWQFQSWGGNCAGRVTTCSITMDQGKNVTANFSQTTTNSITLPQIGTFRDGTWWIDNGNGKKDACTVDTCVRFGISGDQPILGYWTRGGIKQIAVYRRGAWYVDTNGNGRFDGCTGGDTCFSFGLSNHQAVVGDLNGDGLSEIGIFAGGNWYFDTSGNRRWDQCAIDTCVSGFGIAGDQPVMGDWNGDGKDDIGVFRNGTWYLDNGNRKWDGCGIDKCISNFGQSGDLAVVGDWNGDRRSQIGIFRQGEWHFDNGDGVWGACTVDKCITGLGVSGDKPIAK